MTSFSSVQRVTEGPIQSLSEKTNKKPREVNQEFFIQQNHPSKNKGNLNTCPGKQTENSLLLELPYKIY